MPNTTKHVSYTCKVKTCDFQSWDTWFVFFLAAMHRAQMPGRFSKKETRTMSKVGTAYAQGSVSIPRRLIVAIASAILVAAVVVVKLVF